MKKIISLFLALTMTLACFSAGFSAFAITNHPYIDEDGYYRRYTTLSNGTSGYLFKYQTDYGKVLEEIYAHLLNHDTDFSIYFASPDEQYAYTYLTDSDYASANEKAVSVWEEMYEAVFTDSRFTEGRENARGGDYLFNTIVNVPVATRISLSSGDEPVEAVNEGDAHNYTTERYYPYEFNITNAQYTSDIEWEKAVESFADTFSSTYLNPDMSEYERVKTIYDFVVRNTKYDTEVFTGVYKRDTQRYKLAHSAYGAIYGALINSGKAPDDYQAEYKLTATDEKVLVAPDQGLAVCEGFSQLFYFLCVYNGLKCHIVDGDNTADSGRGYDPHEWNYVYVQDYTGASDWYQVDATFSTEKSYKEIDYMNYDYFLRGLSNINFGSKNHQQPYTKGVDDDIKPQLYTWLEMLSPEDYPFESENYTASEGIDLGYIIRRDTDYGGDLGLRTAFIYTSKDKTQKLEIDEDGRFNTYKLEINENGAEVIEPVEGFTYHGKEASYTVIIPYVISEQSIVNDDLKKGGAGQYTVTIQGKENTTYPITFNIEPLNMSNNANYDSVVIDRTATYMAAYLTPEISIVDSYQQKLEYGPDFDLEYTDSEGNAVVAPREIGDYNVKIKFKGNYKGVYKFDFTVEKIRLSKITSTDAAQIYYIPEAIRNAPSMNLPTAADQLAHYQAFGVTLEKGKDYTAVSQGSMEYGGSGTITLSGIDSNSSLTFGGTQNSRILPYVISEKFDITDKSKWYISVADDNSVNQHFYTGEAIEPTAFNILDKYLVQGKDYRIVSYSNNINAGDEAHVVIEGINGCKGTLTLPFKINKADLTQSSFSITSTGGVLNISVSFNGKTLVKDVDYTQSDPVKNKSGYAITISGINNFAGSTIVNIADTANSDTGKPSVTTQEVDGKVVLVTDGTVSTQNPSSSSQSGTASKSSSTSTSSSADTYIATDVNGKKLTLIRPKLTKVSAGKKCFTATWTKVGGKVTGYQIQYSTSKKFTKKTTKTITVKGAKKTSYKVKKLKSKKTYYVRVCTYYKKGKYIYSTGYTVAKKVKVK